jgi:chromosome segregation ATPase
MSQDEAVNTEVVAQETTVTESAPVETNTPEVADQMLDILTSDDEPVVETEEKPEPKEEEIEPPKQSEETQETDTKEQPLSEDKPLSPKAENRFQKLANENKELKAQIEKINAQVYAPQTTEELIDEGLTPELAEVRALKQQLEVSDYNNKVYEAQVSLSNEAEQVLTEFPMFNPDSPEYDEDIASAAVQSLQSALITDPNTGQIIGSHLTPYQIYKPIADAYKKSSLAGQIKGQKATEQMLAAVDATPSATPKPPKKDPLLEILSSDD